MRILALWRSIKHSSVGLTHCMVCGRITMIGVVNWQAVLGLLRPNADSEPHYDKARLVSCVKGVTYG